MQEVKINERNGQQVSINIGGRTYVSDLPKRCERAVVIGPKDRNSAFGVSGGSVRKLGPEELAYVFAGTASANTELASGVLNQISASHDIEKIVRTYEKRIDIMYPNDMRVVDNPTDVSQELFDMGIIAIGYDKELKKSPGDRLERNPPALHNVPDKWMKAGIDWL